MSSKAEMTSGIAPPNARLINDPQHWRDRAEEARAMAAQMHDPEAIAAMLHVAEGYDHLAERAEARRLAPN